MARTAQKAERTRRDASTSSRESTTERRDEVRAIAGRLFAEMGFGHATMRDVADATGILAGSLYYYFKSKDEILLELMQRFHEDILRDLGSVVDVDRAPIETLTEMIHLALRYILERRDEARILTNDYQYMAQSPEFAGVIKTAEKAERIWVDVLRKGVEAGELRPDIDVHIAYATLMGSIFSALRWYRPSGKVQPQNLVDQMSAQLLDGIRRQA